MILKVYSIFDSKIGSYLAPFFPQAKGAAIRAFTEALNDPNHQFSKYPEDFTLFELGEWDDATASFTSHLTPLSVGTGLEFKSKE